MNIGGIESIGSIAKNWTQNLFNAGNFTGNSLRSISDETMSKIADYVVLSRELEELLKNNDNEGPQNPGDYDPTHEGTSVNSNSGPQNPGDPQPHLNGGSGDAIADKYGLPAGGPQKPGDPQPHLNGGSGGPQRPGDPQ